MNWDTSDRYGIDLQAEIRQTPRKRFRDRPEVTRPRKWRIPGPDELCSNCRRWLGKGYRKGRCEGCYHHRRKLGFDRDPERIGPVRCTVCRKPAPTPERGKLPRHAACAEVSP